MLDDMRQLGKFVRRRDVLRYGGIGLITVALAACGRDKDSGGAPGAGGRPAVPRPTVTGAAVAAFARGTWNLSYEPQGQANYEYRRLVITGSRWTLDGDDEKGSFELDGGGLVVRMDNHDMDNVWAASGLPAAVGDKAALTLQWGHHAESGLVDDLPPDTTPNPLPVVWDGKALTIRTKDGLRITAVRA